jgi:hypothetical protein
MDDPHRFPKNTVQKGRVYGNCGESQQVVMVCLHGDSLQKYKITDNENMLCHLYFKIKNKKSHLSAN